MDDRVIMPQNNLVEIKVTGSNISLEVSIHSVSFYLCSLSISDLDLNKGLLLTFVTLMGDFEFCWYMDVL